MGIVFTTTGWLGPSVEVEHASGTEIYEDIAGGAKNALDVANAFLSWLDDGARAWAGALTSITWTAVDDGAGRLVFAYAPVGTTFLGMTVLSDSTRIAVSKVAAGTSPDGTTRGSCSAIPGTVMWERWDPQGGARSRQASWRMGHPQLSHRRPSCEFGFDLEQAYAFGEAIKVASFPRRAYVYDELSATWRYVACGKHDMQPLREDDVTKLKGTLEILGGV